MTPFAVTWHPVAERDLLNIPSWRTAERVAAAVLTFAATGEGAVERASPTTWRLRVAGYRVIFGVNRDLHELLVWRVV